MLSLSYKTVLTALTGAHLVAWLRLMTQKWALEDHTSTVMDYINFCVSNVTGRRTVKGFPNQKPWMCRGVRTELETEHIEQVMQQRAAKPGRH